MEIKDEYLDEIESGIDRFMNWVVIPLCAFGLILLVVMQVMLAIGKS